MDDQPQLSNKELAIFCAGLAFICGGIALLVIIERSAFSWWAWVASAGLVLAGSAMMLRR